MAESETGKGATFYFTLPIDHRELGGVDDIERVRILAERIFFYVYSGDRLFTLPISPGNACLRYANPSTGSGRAEYVHLIVGVIISAMPLFRNEKKRTNK